jgi:hypothetical protein
MQTYTFRTECNYDNRHVPTLLDSIGISDFNKITLTDSVVPSWSMGQYTIKSDLSAGCIRKKLKDQIDNNVLFIDMHRCYQTLTAGNKPRF